MHDLSCVVHVHSRYSDGTATVAEILAAARRTQADAVLLTDHDTLGAKRDRLEGWHDGVLLIVGHEISPKCGHYLAFGLDEEIPHAGRDAAAICRAVADAGGFGFAAHPFSTGSRMAPRLVPPHAWPAFREPTCTGLELWSVTTDVAESWQTPAQAMRFLHNPAPTLEAGPPARHLATWDRLCAQRRMPALGGLDSHQKGLRVHGHVLSPLRHDRCFSWLRTHLVLDRAPTGRLRPDRALVHAAAREGRAFLHRPAAGDARGARFWLRRPGGDAPMGAEVAAGPGTACAALPRAADVRLLRNGALVAQRRAVRGLREPIGEPGAYRIEARIGGRLWLLSNPIYLR